MFFVKTKVDFLANGSAVVPYSVQWRVLSGELHGFYFHATDRLPIERFFKNSYAVDEQRNRYVLAIKRVNNETEAIVIASGKGIGAESVT